MPPQKWKTSRPPSQTKVFQECPCRLKRNHTTMCYVRNQLSTRLLLLQNSVLSLQRGSYVPLFLFYYLSLQPTGELCRAALSAVSDTLSHWQTWVWVLFYNHRIWDQLLVSSYHRTPIFPWQMGEDYADNGLLYDVQDDLSIENDGLCSDLKELRRNFGQGENCWWQRCRRTSGVGRIGAST